MIACTPPARARGAAVHTLSQGRAYRGHICGTAAGAAHVEDLQHRPQFGAPLVRWRRARRAVGARRLRRALLQPKGEGDGVRGALQVGLRRGRLPALAEAVEEVEGAAADEGLAAQPVMSEEGRWDLRVSVWGRAVERWFCVERSSGSVCIAFGSCACATPTRSLPHTNKRANTGGCSSRFAA
eukprot:1763581-Prymnesium_polylepis.1